MVVHNIVGRRILIVEDDYYLAMDMLGALRGAGAEVIGPFATVGDALGSLDQAPDAAVLDLRLGDGTSLPLARELRHRGIPYLFATSSAHELPPAHGATSVVAKPATDALLLGALEAALAA